MKTLLEELVEQEEGAVTQVMAFMSYNPSIGRVLQKGGVRVFQDMMVRFVRELPSITTVNEFDNLHAKYVKELICQLKTTKDKPLSYGQAQKPINVFCKVFIDWALKPDKETSGRLLPFLHVPLDSILMKTIKQHYPDWYASEVSLNSQAKTQEFSISKIGMDTYRTWQEFFRREHPLKPLLFDVAWAINRGR